MTKQKSIRICIAIILLISITNTVHAVTEENCINSIKEAERQIKEGYDYAQAGSNYYSAYKCYEKLGMNGSTYYTLAIESCTKAYNLTGQYYGALCLGDIYEEQKDFDLAIDWYLKSCTSKRENRGDNCAGEYESIASCYGHKNDKEEACKWCEKAAAESSEFKNACKLDLRINCDTATTSPSESIPNKDIRESQNKGNSQNLLLIPVAVGVILLILIICGFYLSKSKKHKK